MKIYLESLRGIRISSILRTHFIFFTFALVTILPISAQDTISSIAELATAAALSDQSIVMEAGVYEMIDYLTPDVIANNTPADDFNRRAMIRFSGSNNSFDLSDVTINVDTELLNDLGGNVIEFHLTGNAINFKGLTVTDIGDSPTASGGQSFSVSGDNIVVENVTLNMSGSSPYGYGDLLGKGGPNLVPMRKHSGLLVGGLNVSIIGCSIYSTSFGHLFFVQGGRNVLFQDCYAEAVTRTTDEMLAETSGPAFDLNFEAVYGNYDGEKVITPGYTKSLSEVGFRTYGGGAGNDTEGVTLINCTARNARVGFALEVGGPIFMQNCEATGCEAGYNVQNVIIESSRGDAVNGPLLYLAGDNSVVELELMPTLPTTILHAVATIGGRNHKVTLSKWNDETRSEEHKILIGASRPAGTNPFSPLGSISTSGILLSNCTDMPIEIMSNTSSSTINTTGSFTDNGSENTIVTDSCYSVEELNFDDGRFTYNIIGTSPNECEVTGFVLGKDTSIAIIPHEANYLSKSFSVVAVSNSAFLSNKTLTDVTLPVSIEVIGNNAFQSCTNLQSINLENILTYGDHSFNGCDTLALAPLDLTNVASTGSYTFLNCRNITSVIVPGSLDLGLGAIMGTGITSFIIPEEWSALPNQMLRNCKSITSISIPSTITSMGGAAFRDCVGLTDIQVNWTSSDEIADATVANLFSGLTLSDINLLVPSGTTEDYLAAPVWKEFNIMQGTLGFNEKALAFSFDIYPNPAREIITLENTQLREIDLTIYDLKGKVLLNFDINKAFDKVNISRLPRGLYIVKAQDGNHVFTKRIIKQ